MLRYLGRSHGRHSKANVFRWSIYFRMAREGLKARLMFGAPDQESLTPPQNSTRTAVCVLGGKAAAAPSVVPRSHDGELSRVALNREAPARRSTFRRRMV